MLGNVRLAYSLNVPGPAGKLDYNMHPKSLWREEETQCVIVLHGHQDTHQCFSASTSLLYPRVV